MAVVLLASDTAFNFAASRETTAEVLGFTLLLGLSTLPGIAVYFLPALLARSTHQRRRIFWLNLLLGWTILGWLGAFLWAILSPPVQAGKAT
jgi:hypothetical protein